MTISLMKIDSNSVGKPDIELLLVLGSVVNDKKGTFRRFFGLSDEFYDSVFSKYQGSNAFSIFPVLLNPKSRGRVSLRSANPFQEPIFDLNYLDREDDAKTMVRGIKKVFSIRLARTKSRRYQPFFLTDDSPERFLLFSFSSSPNDRLSK